MPTEARGNYLLTRDKDLSQPATRVDTTCWQLLRPAINTAHFYFFCCTSYVKLLDHWCAEKMSLIPEPLRPETRGICHICHMVNPTLISGTATESAVEQ